MTTRSSGRNKPEDEFYQRPAWKTLRSSTLRHDGFMCQRHKQLGQMRPAEHVHHIFPREQYEEYQYEPWNLTSLCFECHNKMHNRFNGKLSKAGMILMRSTALQQGIRITSKPMTILVVGLRGTGKTTYVKEQMDSDSLVYDLDAIASAFRIGREEYHKAARKMANDFLGGFMAKAHDYCKTVYVIRTAPRLKEFEMINPDRVVMCTTVKEYLDMDDREGASKRLEELEGFCKKSGMELLKI